MLRVVVDVVTAVGRLRTAMLKHGEERRDGATGTERDEEVLRRMKSERVVDALNDSETS